MAPAMLLARAGPLSSCWLLPAAGSVQLAPPPGCLRSRLLRPLGFRVTARRGCLWVAPGASRGHFSSLALSRMGPVYLAFLFFAPCGAAGPGAARDPGPACLALLVP